MFDEIDMSTPMSCIELQDVLARLVSHSEQEKLAMKAEIDALAAKVELKMPSAALHAVLSSEDLTERILHVESPMGRVFLLEQSLRDALYDSVRRLREEYNNRTNLRDQTMSIRLSTVRHGQDALSARVERLEKMVLARKEPPEEAGRAQPASARGSKQGA